MTDTKFGREFTAAIPEYSVKNKGKRRTWDADTVIDGREYDRDKQPIWDEILKRYIKPDPVKKFLNTYFWPCISQATVEEPTIPTQAFTPIYDDEPLSWESFTDNRQTG